MSDNPVIVASFLGEVRSRTHQLMGASGATNGDPIYDALLELYAELDRLRQRCVEHEQFRHQHRDCDSMGVELQSLSRKLAEALERIETLTAIATEVGESVIYELDEIPRFLSVGNEWSTCYNCKRSINEHLIPGMRCPTDAVIVPPQSGAAPSQD
jgi:hypothetical protein